MTGAAVAVIGGGVMGASVAYHLAALGQRDVVILDRADAPGAGSTGRATGGYRAQYATAINVRLSLLPGRSSAVSPTRPGSIRATRRPAISGSPRAPPSWKCCVRAGWCSTRRGWSRRRR